MVNPVAMAALATARPGRSARTGAPRVGPPWSRGASQLWGKGLGKGGNLEPCLERDRGERGEAGGRKRRMLLTALDLLAEGRAWM